MNRFHPGTVRALALATAFATFASTALGQVVNPADKQRPPGEDEQQDATSSTGRLRSWELPPLYVTAERASGLREEDLIGSYKQPRWTARRLFPTTRVYVRPEGQFELEHWTRVKVPRDGGQTTVETQYEAEIGLGNRWQLDLYLVQEKSGSEGEFDLAEQKFEIRYAFADWGEIWGNPTGYLEWVERSAAADKIEAKLLLGGQLSEGWHWGSNLVYEAETGDAREHEYGVTFGLAHTMIDEKLSLGAELKAALLDEGADRGDYAKELEVGPSMQYRPVPNMHIDLAPLVGIGPESRAADIYMVVGWEF